MHLTHQGTSKSRYVRPVLPELDRVNALCDYDTSGVGDHLTHLSDCFEHHTTVSLFLYDGHERIDGDDGEVPLVVRRLEELARERSDVLSTKQNIERRRSLGDDEGPREGFLQRQKRVDS